MRNIVRTMMRPFTVLVEGNIGSGKSQFLHRFNHITAVDILQATLADSPYIPESRDYDQHTGTLYAD
jgi:hypothetical protein